MWQQEMLFRHFTLSLHDCTLVASSSVMLLAFSAMQLTRSSMLPSHQGIVPSISCMANGFERQMEGGGRRGGGN